MVSVDLIIAPLYCAAFARKARGGETLRKKLIVAAGITILLFIALVAVGDRSIIPFIYAQF